MARALSSREIDAFRAMMQCGTTLAAAEILNTTQPSVSRLLAQAQDAVKFRLFDYRRGRLVPTPEAKMLFEIVQKHYLGLETIQQAAESIRSSGTGLLRIAATPSLAMGVIPTIMKAFRQSSPGVSINLQTGGSLQIRDGLLNGIYDVGLTTSGAHFRTGEFEIEVCDESEALCAVCANSPLASKKEVAVSDFQEATLLTLNRGDDLSDLWRQTLAQHGVKPSSEIEVTYSAILCSLAAADLGIGVVSPYIKPLISDNVRFVRISPRISVKMFAIFPGHLVKSSLSQRFTRSLKETFLHNDPHVVKCGDCTE